MTGADCRVMRFEVGCVLKVVSTSQSVCGRFDKFQNARQSRSYLLSLVNTEPSFLER